VSAPAQLCDRFPQLGASELLAGFIPPPHFSTARFDTYIADDAEPSQARALAGLEAFAAALASSKATRRRRLRKRSGAETRPPGIYLDGGFGVGKTHLLAALWFATADADKRAFGTFVEYTNLVGALGFEQTVAALSDYALVCIDEFELDDPGDTVLMSTLLTRLVEGGVRLAATSNTLPDRLGEGRFAADDFLREIQGLAAKFEIFRIDGQDYRHRGLPAAPGPLTDGGVCAIAQRYGAASSLDSFNALMDHLPQVHPSRYGAMVEGLSHVCVTGVTMLDNQADALRFVVLVDRMYDRDVSLAASGTSVDSVFSEEMLAGGYRKKYRRAVSRLAAMAVSSG
jgi:cell division protein ZapE